MFDIQKFCRDHSVPFITEGHHHCHQGWLQVNCPWCGSKNYHLGFNLSTGAVHCWRCGDHGTWAFLKAIGHKNVKQLFAKYETDKKVIVKQIARAAHCPEPPQTSEMISAHRNYLRKRGFNPTQLQKEWNLKGTRHLSGQWSWRIIIPIYGIDNAIQAYTGRAIKDQPLRYKTTENEKITVNPQSMLYGIHKVEGDTVFIVEGPTGVWRIGPGTVATLGIDWKEAQACQLRYFKRRYIIFDPEPVAQKKAEELATWLSFYPGITEILYGFDTDPGAFSPSDVAKVRSLI